MVTLTFCLRVCCLCAGLISLGHGAYATDPGLAWGGAVSAPNPNFLTQSANNHYVDSLTAITIEGGTNTLLPGATVNAIGVFNEISVVGDNNVIEAIQEGDNSGDVTSTVNVPE